MRYRYTCSKQERCKIADLPEEYFQGEAIDVEVDLESRLVNYTEDDRINVDTSPLVWIVTHGMSESPEIKCPLCDSEAKKVIQQVTSYFRGNCYLDVEGCRREMNIHKLQTNDPYGYMRQPGEKDDMIARLKRGNKPKPKYFGPSSKSR